MYALCVIPKDTKDILELLILKVFNHYPDFNTYQVTNHFLASLSHLTKDWCYVILDLNSLYSLRTPLDIELGHSYDVFYDPRRAFIKRSFTYTEHVTWHLTSFFFIFGSILLF